jgi:hypothetical protein
LLLFLLAELFILERQNPLFSNIHLFEKWNYEYWHIVYFY